MSCENSSFFLSFGGRLCGEEHQKTTWAKSCGRTLGLMQQGAGRRAWK